MGGNSACPRCVSPRKPIPYTWYMAAWRDRASIYKINTKKELGTYWYEVRGSYLPPPIDENASK